MVYIALCLAILLAGFIIGYKVGCDICYNRYKEHYNKKQSDGNTG